MIARPKAKIHAPSLIRSIRIWVSTEARQSSESGALTDAAVKPQAINQIQLILIAARHAPCSGSRWRREKSAISRCLSVGTERVNHRDAHSPISSEPGASSLSSRSVVSEASDRLDKQIG